MIKTLVPYNIIYKNKSTIVYAKNVSDALDILNIPSIHQNSNFIIINILN
jgi:hypothetical protein